MHLDYLRGRLSQNDTALTAVCLIDAQRSGSVSVDQSINISCGWSALRMVRPYLEVVKQPPASVLVGNIFEIEVQASTDGNSYQIKLDDRIDSAETPKPVESEKTSTFRCSCSKPFSSIAILIRLVCKKGKVVATAETSPISVTQQMINVATTKEWTSLWYKDEGGREKSIDLVASLQACEQEQGGGLKLRLKPVLYYAPGTKGLAMVANQDILRILSEDLTLTDDESKIIRFRIEDVSKNHQGQDFRIQLNVVGRPDIAPGISPSITVRSKRNKRFRASINATKQKTVTKKPAHAPIVASHIQKAVCCVMKWSDDAASVLQTLSTDRNAVKCLSEYGYIREQISFLRAASTGESVHFQNSGDSLLELQQRLPLEFKDHKRKHSSEAFPLVKQIPLVESLERMPEPSTKARRREEEPETAQYSNCVLTPARNDHIGLIVADLVSRPGKAKGMPALSANSAFLGIVNKDGFLDKECENSTKVNAYELLRESDQNNLFSKKKYGDRLVDMAWNRATTKKYAEDANDIDSTRIHAENEIEHLLGVTMRSKETDECLGFPVFCSELRFLGFVRERSFGEHSFVLPPTFIKQSDKISASKMIAQYPHEAIFSKKRLKTLDAMADHALVYKWKKFC